MTNISNDSEAQQPWDLFIAVLAHELRNPIAPIRSGLELLASGRLDEGSSRMTISMMQRQLAQLVHLIDNLLNASRINAGSLELRLEPVLLRDLLTSAVDTVQPACDAKGQQIEMDVGPPGIVLQADPARLAQALANVLDDCAKHAPRDSRIAMSVTVRDSDLKVSIEDTRDALDRQAIGHAYRQFTPLGTASNEEGLGVQLALAKGLIALHGGALQREQPEGRNIFVLKLPFKTAAAPAADGHDATPQPLDWHSARVLVVDDNEDAADALAMMLELDGHTVRVSHDGPGGVAQAADFRPDVVVMDIGLPGFDGLEAIRRIEALAIEPRPHLVALTGWSLEADRVASREAGADLHLSKPVDHAELRRSIDEALAKRGLKGTDRHER